MRSPLLSLLLVASLAGCTNGAPPAGAASAAAATTTIDVSLTSSPVAATAYGSGGGYAPLVTTVALGTTVRFVNTDSFAHTATSLGAAPPSRPRRRSAAARRSRRAARFGRLEQRHAGRGHRLAGAARGQGRDISVRLFLPLRRADARSDRCPIERTALVALAALVTLACAAAPRPAHAVPLFAQRYNLRCDACHSVLPELNQFGNDFRNRGYRIDGAPKHGTTIVALREQLGYTETPTDGTTRKFVPAGAALGAAEIGQVEAFVHETLGSEGSSASLFLGYLAYGNAHTGMLYRAGLMELPLVHSPAQRNDTLTTYGYEGTLTGLNDLTLATPRWALEAERNVGAGRVAATLAFGNATGSAYGGKPVETGAASRSPRRSSACSRASRSATTVRIGVDALAGRGASPCSAAPVRRSVPAVWRVARSAPRAAGAARRAVVRSRQRRRRRAAGSSIPAAASCGCGGASASTRTSACARTRPRRPPRRARCCGTPRRT